MPTPPPLWHPFWSDNSIEGNITPPQSAGAVSGGQALSPPIPGDSQFVEILGFQKSRKNVSDAPRASAIALTHVDNTRERPYRAGNPPIIAKTQKRTSGKIIASSVDVFLTGLKIQVFYKTLKKTVPD